MARNPPTCPAEKRSLGENLVNDGRMWCSAQVRLRKDVRGNSISWLYAATATPFRTWRYQLIIRYCWCILTTFGTDYTPRFNEVERGVYWYHLVRLSVCGQNRVRSVSSTILIGSISYLHILSSNFRRCVVCNICFNIQKFEILANFLNL